MILVSRNQENAISLDGANCMNITRMYSDETHYQITVDTLGGCIVLRDNLSKDVANIIFWDVLHEYEKGAKIYRF